MSDVHPCASDVAAFVQPCSNAVAYLTDIIDESRISITDCGHDDWHIDVTVTYPKSLKGVDKFRPKTKLGRALMEIRERILASGTKLMSMDEIVAEVESRRGGIENKNIR